MINKGKKIDNLKEKIEHNMNENMGILTQEGQNFLKDGDNHNAVQELIEILIKNEEDNKNSSGGGLKVVKKRSRRITFN